jgi:hypothetical protein
MKFIERANVHEVCILACDSVGEPVFVGCRATTAPLAELANRVLVRTLQDEFR